MSDRADRLSKRRKQTEGKVREQAETDEPSKPSEPDETGEPDEPDEPAQTDETGDGDETDEQSVKDEQVGTYLYLPEGQRDELRYQYKLLSAEYEREFGDELEKNRHFYPLVVEYGLDRLDGADAQDVQELLDGLEY